MEGNLTKLGMIIVATRDARMVSKIGAWLGPTGATMAAVFTDNMLKLALTSRTPLVSLVDLRRTKEEPVSPFEKVCELACEDPRVSHRTRFIVVRNTLAEPTPRWARSVVPYTPDGDFEERVLEVMKAIALPL